MRRETAGGGGCGGWSLGRHAHEGRDGLYQTFEFSCPILYIESHVSFDPLILSLLCVFDWRGICSRGRWWPR